MHHPHACHRLLPTITLSVLKRSGAARARHRAATALVMAVLCISGARASTQDAEPDVRSISFDDNSSSCYFKYVVPLTNAYATRGVVFVGPTPVDGGAVLDGCSGYEVYGYSPPNFLAFHDADSAEMINGGIPRAPETLSFPTPINQLSFKAGTGDAWSGTLVVYAYAPDGTLVDEAAMPLENRMGTLHIAAPLIDHVLLEASATAFVLDDLTFSPVADDDGDGDYNPSDCAPQDPSRHHDASERCDGVDQNCNGVADEGFTDTDSDGQTDCVDMDDDGDGTWDSQDCAPLDPSRYPSALELCDGIDQDCDGDLVEKFPDADHDATPDCVDPDDDDDGADDAGDCAPLDPARYPGATELCDAADQDCDGQIDEGFADADADQQADCVDPDDDGDGAPDPEDCAPGDPATYSGQIESCDGLDNNCDGVVDPGDTCSSAGDDDDASPSDGDDSPTPSGNDAAGCGCAHRGHSGRSSGLLSLTFLGMLSLYRLRGRGKPVRPR